MDPFQLISQYGNSRTLLSMKKTQLVYSHILTGLTRSKCQKWKQTVFLKFIWQYWSLMLRPRAYTLAKQTNPLKTTRWTWGWSLMLAGQNGDNGALAQNLVWMKEETWDLKQGKDLVTYHKMVECLARRVMQLMRGGVLLHFVLSIFPVVSVANSRWEIEKCQKKRIPQRNFSCLD